uniref:RNA helicase n=1 Tax=Photinus pyralis TaxID=7054 RepID=A0A1Y1N3Q9_PHOPY
MSESNKYKRKYGRFRRGGGDGGFKKTFKQTQSQSDGNNEEGEQPRPYGKHPANLRGKAIGLYYAARAKQARVVAEVVLPESRRMKISDVLERENYTQNLNASFKEKYENLISGRIEDKLEAAEEIQPSPTLDADLKLEFEKRRTSAKYLNMLDFRKKLPSYKLKTEIIEMIAANQVILLSGETGCGKTTQVAQFILDDYVEKGKGSCCRIVCTQPRRISAISVAERVAVERAESLGVGVGYQIRLEKVMPREKGSILFCTTGVILRLMEGDPCLNKVSHIIIDEIHERSIHSDFLITLLKDVLVKRPNLKVILMSATLNAEKFSAYFNNCPHLNIPGFTFPVQEFYLEDVLMKTNFCMSSQPFKKYTWRDRKRDKDDFYTSFMEPYVRQLEANKTCSAKVCAILRDPQLEAGVNMDLIFALIVNICETERDPGAILVFLTGFVEISSLNQRMETCGKFPSNKFLIVPIHSQMPTVNQRQVFDRPPPGVRKIVLSTNIAETSITIDDVVFVIDCGKIKYTDYDPQTNNYTLQAHWVALANADQRRGRAGRVQPGVCYHLFSRPRRFVLEKYQKAEILRTRLENTILTIKVLQIGTAAEFLSKLIDSPNPDAIAVSIDLLQRMNALDENENLTPLGYHLAYLPIAPQMGKMVIFGVLFSCLDPVLSVAASLDFKDAFLLPLGKEREVEQKRRELSNGLYSDHLLLYNALKMFESQSHYDANQFCWKYFLSPSILMQLQKMKKQFMEYLLDMNFVDSTNYKDPDFNYNSRNVSLIKAVLCAGLYPNVGTLRGKKRFIGRTLEGQKVDWHLKSVLAKEIYFPSRLFVYYLKLQSSKRFIHDATIVYPLPIIFFGDKYSYDQENTTLNLAGEKLKFKCSEETNTTIKQLRDRLNMFLEYKISNPGVIKWSWENNEISVLRAVMELITSEEMGDLSLGYEDFD